jgi:hypothetical protein
VRAPEIRKIVGADGSRAGSRSPPP